MLHRSSFAAATAAALLVAGPVTAAQDPAVAGKAEYEALCANCHGRTGTGDGPIASVLTIKPADLTQIAKRNGGQFPLQQIYQLIEGRVVSPAHGTSKMPIWGTYYSEKGQPLANILGEAFAEDYVRGRILSLVYYLQTIQKD
jgi:mono/diheme cytochrome c family protein